MPCGCHEPFSPSRSSRALSHGHPSQGWGTQRLLLPIPTSSNPHNPTAAHLGISGGKACECSIFPRGFTSPHGVRPFASPACCEGPEARRDRGTRSPPLPSAPHTAAGSSSHRATEVPQRSGRHPAGREGRRGRGHGGPSVGSEAAQGRGFPNAKVVLCDSLCKEHHEPHVPMLSWQKG